MRVERENCSWHCWIAMVQHLWETARAFAYKAFLQMNHERLPAKFKLMNSRVMQRGRHELYLP